MQTPETSRHTWLTMAERFRSYFKEIHHAITLALFFKQQVNTADQRSSQHLRQALLDNDLRVAPKTEIWVCARLAHKASDQVSRVSADRGHSQSTAWHQQTQALLHLSLNDSGC